MADPARAAGLVSEADVAAHPRRWALAALGPVPAQPVDRLGWQQRAASIGARRELSGYDDG